MQGRQQEQGILLTAVEVQNNPKKAESLVYKSSATVRRYLELLASAKVLDPEKHIALLITKTLSHFTL